MGEIKLNWGLAELGNKVLIFFFTGWLRRLCVWWVAESMCLVGCGSYVLNGLRRRINNGRAWI